MTRSLVLGLDVGGTKAAGVLMDADGSIRATGRLPTPAEDVEGVLETIGRLADQLRERGEAGAIGVGAAGMVEWDTGTMRWAPNIAWRDVPLRELVHERTGLPTVVDNDANTAAWGEYRYGAGRGHRHVLVVTVGTGIGGGIVMDGRLMRGAHGFAAEIGHIIVEPDGPLCGCGNLGCWEQVAGGQALDRLAREAADLDPGGPIASLAGGAEAVGRHVAAAARDGDGEAVRILETVGRRLGEGLAGLANVLDPEVIVVGGGVAEVAAILDSARARFREAVEAPDHRPEIPIVPATLGNDAGAIGAAELAVELVGAG